MCVVFHRERKKERENGDIHLTPINNPIQVHGHERIRVKQQLLLLAIFPYKQQRVPENLTFQSSFMQFAGAHSKHNPLSFSGIDGRTRLQPSNFWRVLQSSTTLDNVVNHYTLKMIVPLLKFVEATPIAVKLNINVYNIVSKIRYQQTHNQKSFGAKFVQTHSVLFSMQPMC